MARQIRIEYLMSGVGIWSSEPELRKPRSGGCGFAAGLLRSHPSSGPRFPVAGRRRAEGGDQSSEVRRRGEEVRGEPLTADLCLLPEIMPSPVATPRAVPHHARFAAPFRNAPNANHNPPATP